MFLSQSAHRHQLPADIAPSNRPPLGIVRHPGGNIGRYRPTAAASNRGPRRRQRIAGNKKSRDPYRAGGDCPPREAMASIRFTPASPQASEFTFMLFALSPHFSIPHPGTEPAPEYDAIPLPTVIVRGFVRMGQIVGRVPHMHGIRTPDRSMSSAASATRSVSATRPAPTCCARLAPNRRNGRSWRRMTGTLFFRTVEVARPNVPNLQVFARARNRRHAHLLMDRTVDGLVRDTFHSSPGLAEDSLVALGIPAEDAAHSVALFRDHDERNSIEAQAIYRDEKQLIQSTRQAAEELTSLFEADRRGEAR